VQSTLVSQVTPPSAAPEREVVLELAGLTAGYGDLAAVRDVDLTLAAGEMVALFGPNGAGKTTLLLATVGVLPRMKGTVRWLGAPTRAAVHKLSRAGLFFVPEQRSVIYGLSVRDNLRLGRGEVDAALAHFPELEALLDRSAGLLSGGEQQMLTLARALACRPRALLIDELSLGLAPLVVDRLMSALRLACDRDGLAVLLVEQQARRALASADRWYLLSNGCVTGSGRGGESVSVLEAAYLADLSVAGAGVPDASTPVKPAAAARPVRGKAAQAQAAQENPAHGSR